MTVSVSRDAIISAACYARANHLVMGIARGVENGTAEARLLGNYRMLTDTIRDGELRLAPRDLLTNKELIADVGAHVITETHMLFRRWERNSR